VATNVRGVDWDEAKVSAGRTASKGLDIALDVGDVREWSIPECDTVTLVDVLHYLPRAAQDALLERAAKKAARAVLVRGLDPDRGWRSAITRAQEAVTTSFGYNEGERLEYAPIASMVTLLEANGFRASTE